MNNPEEDSALLNPAGQEPTSLTREVMERYGIEQDPVEFLAEGTWMYASDTSAVVVLETSQRARTTLECAGMAPLENSDYHYIHLFYLTNLDPDAEYPLRCTATDRRGNQAESAVIPVKTRRLPKAMRIPEQAPGPPYVLDQPGACYLLTQDIEADGTALRIAASHVTLDLGGHRVTYNGKHLDLDVDAEDFLSEAAFGITADPRLSGIRILNGTVLQGKGQNRASDATVGFNPLYLREPRDVEIAGLTCEYAGTQLSGIVCRQSGPDTHIHHSVVDDQGRVIANRHQMCCAIRLDSESGGQLHHNLVRRTRQSALGNTGKRVRVSHNELHIDSHSINSFGIAVKDHSTVHDNCVFGCGDNAVGLVTTGGCKDIQLYRNYIWLHAHDISAYKQYLNTKEMESSSYSIMSGTRITWGCSDVDYRDNTILVTAREGGFVRGTFLYNDAQVHRTRFRDSLVIAIAEDEQSHGWGAIAGVGNETRGPTEPLLFEGNTIVSNFANFNMQDTYGVSLNYHFVANTFVRAGRRPGYATLRARQIRPSQGHLFLDNHFADDAGFHRLLIGDEDQFTVQWTCALDAQPGAVVTIDDVSGNQVFSDTVGPDGRISVPLTHFVQQGDARTEFPPYTVTITIDGQQTTRVINSPGEGLSPLPIGSA